jgi:predicted secreted protein
MSGWMGGCMKRYKKGRQNIELNYTGLFDKKFHKNQNLSSLLEKDIYT